MKTTQASGIEGLAPILPCLQCAVQRIGDLGLSFDARLRSGVRMHLHRSKLYAATLEPESRNFSVHGFGFLAVSC